MINQLNYLFVTLFGIGKIKGIPGTYASFFTTVFLFLIFYFFNFNPIIFLIILFVVFFISIYSINLFTKKNDNKDPKEVVIDEFIGQSIPICLYEISHDKSDNIIKVLIIYSIMFILFRIFDIFKPFPANFFDKNIKNSFGVIMDDICAGLYVVLIFVIYMTLAQ
tara:strand:- start:189 stop:683 length:495 start_codon:yes stop_codon:yes gene_type:complete